MNIKKYLLLSIIITGFAFQRSYSLQVQYSASQNTCTIFFGSLFKIGSYYLLNKITKNKQITYTLPVMGTIHCNISEALTEGTASCLRSVLCFLKDREILTRHPLKFCKKKDLLLILSIFIRVAIEQLITAKHFDAAIARSLTNQNTCPKKYRTLQIGSKWLIETIAVLGLGFVTHLKYPITNDKDWDPYFLPCIPALPCTTLSNLFWSANRYE